VAGYGPTCAKTEGLLPDGVPRRKKRRARKPDENQLELPITDGAN